MIVNGDKTQMYNYHGDYEEMEAIRKKLHGNYILADAAGRLRHRRPGHDGTKPQALRTDRSGRQQEALGAQQEKLGEEQDQLGKQQEEAHIETPDMSKEIAELQDAVKLQLQDAPAEQDGHAGRAGRGSVTDRLGIEGNIGAMEGQHRLPGG